MIQNLKEKFKKNPTFYYSMSICATWAGAGSLLVGVNMARDCGIVPFLLWAFGNTITCILLGLVADKVPTAKRIMLSKPVKIIMGILCIIQVWINMSGINDALSGTMLGGTTALIVTLIVAVAFLILYLKNELIRNVLTDHGSWWIVIFMIVALVFVAISSYGATPLVSGIHNSEGMISGLTKCIYLIPGSFLYPCFWKLLEYNETNEDGTEKVDMKKCFIYGGLIFGAYLCFVFLLSMTQFGPVLGLIKGILVAIIAMSSLTSFIYSIFITFGKKIGFVINLVSIASWYFVMPLGITTLWSKMQEIRFAMVIIIVIISIILNIKNKKAKGVKN